MPIVKNNLIEIGVLVEETQSIAEHGSTSFLPCSPSPQSIAEHGSSSSHPSSSSEFATPNNFEEHVAFTPSQSTAGESCNVLRENRGREKEWNVMETKLLLDHYEIYLKDIGPLKKFRNKKAMWSQIAYDIKEQLHVEYTPLQCENRYKTILKRKRNAVVHNRKTGGVRCPVDYEDELGRITALDDSIEPDTLRDENNVVQKVSAVQPATKRQKNNSNTMIMEDMLIFLKEKEASRERRHQETLDLVRLLLEK